MTVGHVMEFDLGANIPSMKSRANILTRFGRSFLLHKSLEVTMGNFSKSLDLSCGKRLVLCCHLLSCPSLSPSLLEGGWYFRTDCLPMRNGSKEWHRNLEHVSWENSCRRTLGSSAESISVNGLEQSMNAEYPFRSFCRFRPLSHLPFIRYHTKFFKPFNPDRGLFKFVLFFCLKFLIF